MKLIVEKYDEHWQAHKCVLPDGRTRYVDLLVSWAEGEPPTPEQLVGKTVECESTFPFIDIATDARLAKTSKD